MSSTYPNILFISNVFFSLQKALKILRNFGKSNIFLRIFMPFWSYYYLLFEKNSTKTVLLNIFDLVMIFFSFSKSPTHTLGVRFLPLPAIVTTPHFQSANGLF